ncbi:MAG: dTDP-4-dehydrorhamnose 3,5-epimerase family protein [Endomicrobium sp.]|jgi:dTDP-4-dehydrorhamnose 3,5-epimerase|nr:dTDP-4-dehydrorhamnose 3,5-epimerase family protein [Endomicrobium sp.]
MKFTSLKIKGSFLIELDKHWDKRGIFTRFFCKEEFSQAGIKFNPVQSNISLNYKKGTLRGLHFQKNRETKLVSCLQGACFDVFVDIDKKSPTYLKWESFKLSQNGRFILLIPPFCAHGYQTLKDNTVIHYLANSYFEQKKYYGFRWNDPKIGIKWPRCKNKIINERDKNYELI